MIQFILCGLLASLFMYLSQYRKYRPMKFIAFAIITYIMGLQDNIAVDFNAYATMFEKILSGEAEGTFLGYSSRSGLTQIEYGWYILNEILGSLINSYHFVSFVASGFICYSIYKITQNLNKQWLWFAILYFYFLPMRFCMSGIRQAMAMACLILIVYYIQQKNWKAIFIYTLIGLSMHNSMLVALLITPIMYISDSILDKYKKHISILLFSLYIIILIQSVAIREMLIENFLDTLSSEAEHYTGYLATITETESTLTNRIFRFINFSFILYAFYNSKNYERKIIFIYLISAYVVAIIGENSPIARLNNYFSFFAIPAMCIIPSITKNNIIKYSFIVITLVYLLKTFYAAMDHYQYVKYLDYHTIIF